MSVTKGLAASVTRAWIRLYTIGMPLDLREARRLEIEADLWEHRQDAGRHGVPRVACAAEMLLRALAGVPDDLTWRFEAIRARRDAASERSHPMLTFSARQTRLMGLAGLIGGVVWAGRYLVTVETAPAVRAYGHIALSALFIAGLVAFYAQYHGNAGKTGKAGFALLFTSLSAWSALNVLGTVLGIGDHTLVMNLLGVAFVLPLGPGFFLLGIGLKGPARGAPLAIACAFALWLFTPRAVLAQYFPSVTNWSRGDSPLGVAVFFLVGVGLAAMGYSVVRSAAVTPGQARHDG